MAEGARLESVFTGNRNGGSNPPPSANISFATVRPCPASLPIGHVNLDQRIVFQDAREVRTKNRKTMSTWCFPVGADFEAIVVDWINFLTHELLFGPTDPLQDDPCRWVIRALFEELRQPKATAAAKQDAPDTDTIHWLLNHLGKVAAQIPSAFAYLLFLPTQAGARRSGRLYVRCPAAVGVKADVDPKRRNRRQ